MTADEWDAHDYQRRRRRGCRTRLALAALVAAALMFLVRGRRHDTRPNGEPRAR